MPEIASGSLLTEPPREHTPRDGPVFVEPTGFGSAQQNLSDLSEDQLMPTAYSRPALGYVPLLRAHLKMPSDPIGAGLYD